MTQYVVYHLLCDNTQGTLTKTCYLPQGMNLLVGVQFFGDASNYFQVYDRAYGNANTRFSRYSTLNAENYTVAMAFQTRTMVLRMVTPASNGYRGMIVTVQNTPSQERFLENQDFRPDVLPKVA